MCGSFAYIQTQPLSFAQKLVQARVYAQGLTLASLLGMAAITSIPSAGDKLIEEQSHAGEHSWRDMIGESANDDSKQRSGPQGKSQGKEGQQQSKKGEKETEEHK